MYFLNIFPLEEQYMNNAKTDELIIDPKTGHITVCTNTGTGYISNSKDMEAELNGLVSTKNRFYNEYITISDQLEDAASKLLEDRSNLGTILESIDECKANLAKVTEDAMYLLTIYDTKYKKYNNYLYNEMQSFKDIIRENTKKVIVIDILVEEMQILSQDITHIADNNNKVLNDIKYFHAINI